MVLKVVGVFRRKSKAEALKRRLIKRGKDPVLSRGPVIIRRKKVSGFAVSVQKKKRRRRDSFF